MAKHVLYCCGLLWFKRNKTIHNSDECNFGFGKFLLNVNKDNENILFWLIYKFSFMIK